MPTSSAKVAAGQGAGLCARRVAWCGRVIGTAQDSLSLDIGTIIMLRAEDGDVRMQ